MLERFIREVRQGGLLKPGDRVAVAVSGGADSIALLRLLLAAREELGLVLSVTHLHHHIRGADADADQQFVTDVAQQHGLPLHTASVNVPELAHHAGQSLEAAARAARTSFFGELLTRGIANRVATAHTLDDQAETVLMRMLRGAAMRGLAGIYPRVEMQGGAVVRPLLWARRPELRAWLEGLAQPWREDASNRDFRHLRNRVRHELLPLLESNYNPGVTTALAELAEVARGEEEYWNQGRGLITALHVEEVEAPEVPGGRDLVAELDLGLFRDQKLAVRRRVLRRLFDILGVAPDFQRIELVLRMCGDDGPMRHQLTHGWFAIRQGDHLRFRRGGMASATGYQYRLLVPGEITVPELGVRLRTVRVAAGQGYNPGQLLDARKLGTELLVRNWHAGDRFFPAHSSGPKKLKELLAHVPSHQRQRWPVVVAGEIIVWVPGLGVHAEYLAQDEGVLIEQV